MDRRVQKRKAFTRKAITEAVTLTRNRQPVSLFSRIHSSAEKDYVSTNVITYEAINYLINVGPDPLGHITADAQRILRGVAEKL